MRYRYDVPAEFPDAGQSSAFARSEYERRRRAMQERDRGDALGALTFLGDLFWLGVLVAASIAVGACIVALAT